MESSSREATLGSAPETRWLKRILLPFWLCRCLLLVLMGIAYIAAIYWISQEINIKGGLLASTIILILLNILCVSLDLASMILLARHALKPRTFLLFQVFETTIWTVLLILEVVFAVRASQTRNFLSWFLSIILYLSFLGLLIYAAMVYHRSRHASKTGDDTQAATRVTSYDGAQHTLVAPVNPFSNVYAVHSRSVSQTSELSLPMHPSISGSSTPRSQQDGFVIVTPPESAGLRSIPSNPNSHRYA